MNHLEQEKDERVEDSIIKDERNKEIDEKTIEDLKNFHRFQKEIEVIKGRIIRDINNLFEWDEDYKLVRVGDFWSNNYILNVKVIMIKIKHYQLKNHT